MVKFLPIIVLILFAIFLFYPRHQSELEHLILPSFKTDKLWSLIQEWRQSQGLMPYIKDQRLCDIAELRAKEINKDYSHDAFAKRFKVTEFEIAENIASYKGSAEFDELFVLNGWLASPPHKKALLHNYKYSCLACKTGYCAQIFSNL